MLKNTFVMPPKRKRGTKVTIEKDDNIEGNTTPATRRSNRTAAKAAAENLNTSPKPSRRGRGKSKTTDNTKYDTEVPSPPKKAKGKKNSKAFAEDQKTEETKPELINVDEIKQSINQAVKSDDSKMLADALDKGKAELKQVDIIEPFFTSVQDLKYDCIEAFVTAKLKVRPNEFRNTEGKFPLFIALEKEDTKLVETLCKANISSKVIRRGAGETPLHRAAALGNLAMVDAMLKSGFDPNSGFHYGRYPLHTAIKHGHEEVAIRIYEAGAKPGQPEGEERATPLILAAERDMDKLVDLLLKRKIDINVVDWTRESAFFKAVIGDNVEMARKLLERGAYPDRKGLTPDMDAPHREGYGDKPLFVAIENQKEDMVRLLLGTEEVDVNYCCDFYRNLDYAVTTGNLNIIKMLLDAGADPDLTSSNGMNPLHHLTDQRAGEQDEEIFKILVEKMEHKKISVPDSYKGRTPLINAIRNDNVPLVKCLIQANCDVNTKASSDPEYNDYEDLKNMTPLEVAVRRKSRNFIKMLLDAGCEKSGLSVDVVKDEEDGEFQTWLREHLEGVVRLKVLCRCVIRKAMGPKIMTKSLGKNLPQAIRDFILMKEFDSIPVS